VTPARAIRSDVKPSPYRETTDLDKLKGPPSSFAGTTVPAYVDSPLRRQKTPGAKLRHQFLHAQRGEGFDDDRGENC
jgi:hypothetical protein